MTAIDPTVLEWWAIESDYAHTLCEGGEEAVLYLVREMIAYMRGVKC